jgi:Methyltransferase domain
MDARTAPNTESIVDRVQALDASLFDCVPSQTNRFDRWALLSLHAAVAAGLGRFGYLEIGSYLGGSLQVLVRDPRCARALSIDPRLAQPPDKRPGAWIYDANTTDRMRELLGSLDNADLSKLITIEASTEELHAGELPFRPALCFIDGEHTDEAALRDARFCRAAMAAGPGIIAFHDYRIVDPAIRTFLGERWSEVSGVVVFAGSVLAVEFGAHDLLRSRIIERAVASEWHIRVWRAASASGRSPLPLFFALAAVYHLDRLIVRARRISLPRRPSQGLSQ